MSNLIQGMGADAGPGGSLETFSIEPEFYDVFCISEGHILDEVCKRVFVMQHLLECFGKPGRGAHGRLRFERVS